MGDIRNTGMIEFISFVWNNKEIIFSNENPKKKMKRYFENLTWKNTSLGISKNPKVIADIGSHYGEFSFPCLGYFPQSKIYAYEPILQNYNKINSTKNYYKDKDCSFSIDFMDSEFDDFISQNNQFINEIIQYGNSGFTLGKFVFILENFYNCLKPLNTNSFGNLLKEINIHLRQRGELENLMVFNHGLWSKDTNIVMGKPKEDDDTGCYSFLHPQGHYPEKVKFKDIKSLKERPELVKLDVEGSEWEILNDCGNYFDETKILYVEILERDHPNFNRHDEISPLLKSRGFFEIDPPDNSVNKLYGRI